MEYNKAKNKEVPNALYAWNWIQGTVDDKQELTPHSIDFKIDFLANTIEVRTFDVNFSSKGTITIDLMEDPPSEFRASKDKIYESDYTNFDSSPE